MSKSLAPFRSRFLPELFEDFDRDLNRFFGFSRLNGNREMSEWFNPTLSLSETETAYEVALDLPGMKRDDINIEVKNGELWITGERKHESMTESPVESAQDANAVDAESAGGTTEIVGPHRTWHRVESSYGMFRRMIRLGDNVKGNEAAAGYQDGVLTITVPKAEAVVPHRVEIKS